VLALTAPGASAVVRPAADEPVRLFTITDPRITESSGLATSSTLPGVVWTVNDSGDKPRVYGIDSTGKTVATLTLRGAPARDTEAVAVGPRVGGGSWLWVGDIGDNLSSWPTVRVYRAPEPSEVGDRDVPWSQYDLRFPDGPRDAETLLVDPDDGRLYVVSKRVQGAAVYAAPKTLSSSHVNVLTKVAAAPPLVTDGSFASDGRLVIRDYLRAYVSAGVGEPSEPLALPLQPQGESVTWTADGGAVLVGSEGEDSEVWRVAVPAAVVASSAAATPSANASPSRTATASSAAPVDEPASSVPTWLVVLVGLAVGGGVGFLARRARRSRRAP
jgi:hypothetical protein